MRIYSSAFCLLIFLAVLTSCSTLPVHYQDLVSRSDMTLDEIINEVSETRVIFVGELHADPASHRLEFEVIRRLSEAGRKVAIAYEMFPYTKQKALDDWVSGSISMAEFRGIYGRTVKIPYKYYSDIFGYARENGLPIYGINEKTSIVRNVSKKGISTVSAGYLRELGFTNCSEDQEYSDLYGFSENRQYHGTQLPFLCDAQRLRDASMSYRIAEILKGDNEVTLVVLVGAAHAAKVAVPGMLAIHGVYSYRVIMPDVFKHIIKRPQGPDIADYVWY